MPTLSYCEPFAPTSSACPEVENNLKAPLNRLANNLVVLNTRINANRWATMGRLAEKFRKSSHKIRASWSHVAGTSLKGRPQ
jgi:hypothetical protein